MELVTGHLADAESLRLSSRVLALFDKLGDARGAFEKGVLDADGQQLGQWLVLHVDWKDGDEIEWQVDQLLSSFGEPTRWGPLKNTTTSVHSVPVVLDDAAAWLRELGYALLTLDLEGDSYHALLVRASDLDLAMVLAKATDLSVGVDHGLRNHALDSDVN